jgi:hypothetical protein
MLQGFKNVLGFTVNARLAQTDLVDIMLVTGIGRCMSRRLRHKQAFDQAATLACK